MDAITPKKLSRWSRDAILDEKGKPTVAYVTDRDVEIFKLLARYRYLPADFIHAFMGGDYQSLIKRLNLLCRKPNLYLNRPVQQREHAEANYRKLIYELDSRAITVLAEHGLTYSKKYHRNFVHELLVCQIAASLELGTKGTPNVSIIDWPTIMASERFPAATRKLAHPLSIPFNGDEHLTPDWQPFVIKRDGLAKFFPGFEADCGTEPINASDDERSSIKAKFRAYLTIMEQEIFKSHFGANTFTVAFITTNTTRMQSMMALLERMNPGAHARHFLFKTAPSFTSYKKTFEPTGHMLTEPWKRVGHADVFLDRGGH